MKNKLDIPEKLQEKIIGGDKRAMAKFVELTYSDAFKTALRMTRNIEDAKDICQNAFVHFFRSLKDFKGKSSLKTWLYRIVINCSIDTIRMNKLKTVGLDEKLINIEEPTPFKNITNKELSHQIQSAIDKLGPRQKAIFNLKHFDGMKFEQIAAIMGISTNTAKTHFYRAISGLKESLRDYMEE